MAEPGHVPVYEAIVRPVVSLLYCCVAQDVPHQEDVTHRQAELHDRELAVTQFPVCSVSLEECCQLLLAPLLRLA